MILSRLLKPKWQHPDPRVRKRALEKLSERDDDERNLLERFAAQDDEPDLRRAALKRLSNLALLRERSETDPDAGVREVASARYRQLLAGGMEEVGLDARLREVKTCDNLSVLSHLARRARELELRVAALDRLPSGSVLEDAAVNDPAPRVRQFAAARLSDPDALERVKRASRDKDRKVYRLAQDALKALREAEAAESRRLAEWTTLCEEAEALSRADWRASLPAEIARLDNRWRAVGEGPERGLLQRFKAAMSACRTLAEAKPENDQPTAEAPSRESEPGREVAGEPAESFHESRPDRAAQLESLCRRFEAGGDVDPGLFEQMETVLAGCRPGQEGESEVPSGLVDRLREYHGAAERYLGLQQKLTRADTRAERMLAEEKSDPSQAAENLTRMIEHIAWPADCAAPSPLAHAKDTAHATYAAAEERLTQWRSLGADLEETLDRLAKAREAGNLKDAQKLIRRAERAASHLPEKILGPRARRLRRLSAQINELRDWRRFATLPKQTELCERMEALADSSPSDPPERAKAIKALQEEWRATGGSDSPQSQQLWRRFSHAADSAFEPCRAYFAEQAERRHANLAERERICGQLESFLSSADWQRVTADALDRIFRQARREWRAYSPVDNRPGRPLQERFDGAMETLRARLSEKQDEFRVLKLGLLGQAEAAASDEDISRAVRLVKSLQQQWRNTGAARPGDERRLRKAFKTACDEVFQRRERLRQEVAGVREEHRAEADRLCQGLDALQELPDEDFADAAPAALSQATQQFRGLGSLPRDIEGDMRKRFTTACRAVESRLEAITQSRWRRDLDALANRAELCAHLEREVFRGIDTARLGELENEWQHGPEVRPEWQAAMNERWRRARAAADGTPFSADDVAETESARRRMCVQMEILAGVDSPPEDEQLRMALQVERLAHGMSDGVRETPEEVARRLEISWYLASPLGAREGAELQDRFNRARAAIGADHP